MGWPQPAALSEQTDLRCRGGEVSRMDSAPRKEEEQRAVGLASLHHGPVLQLQLELRNTVTADSTVTEPSGVGDAAAPSPLQPVHSQAQ